jgi:tetratricopeptide (TPR) repeat protein
MALFRKVIGKTCRSTSCLHRGQPADPSRTYCAGCNRKLAAIKAPYRPKDITALAAFVTAICGAATIALNTLQPPVVQLLPFAGSAQEAGTLTQLSQLGARLREIYHDCRLGEREAEEVNQLLVDDPNLAKVYPEFQRTRMSHVLTACRKVRSGQLLVAQKLFDRARADFLTATEEDPENANAWAALGGVCMLTDREEEARQAYERALTIEPDNWMAHFNYGCYFARKGETESALGHLKRAVTLLDRAAHVDRSRVREDLRQNPALGALRQDPRFERLLDSV